MKHYFFFFILFLTQTDKVFSQFEVFSENLKQGLKNKDGEILIQPKYEKIGWSDGKNQVIGEVIGFRKYLNWGLVNTKGKEVTANSYQALIPIENGLFKATIQNTSKNFQNQCGIIDKSGKVIISFNYFDVSFEKNLYVYTLSNTYKSGVFDEQERTIIPPNYNEIKMTNHLIIARRKTYYDFFTKKGVEIANSVSHFSKTSSGWICTKNGIKGFINLQGKITHPFKYKEIFFKGGELIFENFPKWEIFIKNTKQFDWYCDSLHWKNNQWIAYLNGVQHLIFPKKEQTVKHDYTIHHFLENHLIISDEIDNTWAVIDKNGDEIINGYDFISGTEKHYLCKKNNSWDLFNTNGTKLHLADFDDIIPGKNHFIAKKNGMWGLVDYFGKSITSFLYDSIIENNAGYYEAKIFDKWGVMDVYGTWDIKPEYDELFTNQKNVFAKSDSKYYVFNNGAYLKAIVAKPVKKINGFTLVQDGAFYGLFNDKGKEILLPLFQEITFKSPYFVAKSLDFAITIDTLGNKIIRSGAKIQDVGTTSENRTIIRKDNAWGFVDEQARLRIANRYEAVLQYSEGLAGIKIKGKWGFLNFNDQIIIQPIYNEVGFFQNGITKIRQDNFWGLINNKGEIVLKPKYYEITFTDSGNYIFKTNDLKVGIMNSEGKMILSPNFDEIEDLSTFIIVKQGKRKGVLDYSGNQLFPIKYQDIKVEGEIIFLKSIE